MTKVYQYREIIVSYDEDSEMMTWTNNFNVTSEVNQKCPMEGNHEKKVII